MDEKQALFLPTRPTHDMQNATSNIQVRQIKLSWAIPQVLIKEKADRLLPLLRASSFDTVSDLVEEVHESTTQKAQQLSKSLQLSQQELQELVGRLVRCCQQKGEGPFKELVVAGGAVGPSSQPSSSGNKVNSSGKQAASQSIRVTQPTAASLLEGGEDDASDLDSPSPTSIPSSNPLQPTASIQSFLSTGVQSLDSLLLSNSHPESQLQGGIPRGSSFELVGPTSSGKTAFCIQLAVSERLKSVLSILNESQKDGVQSVGLWERVEREASAVLILGEYREVRAYGT